MCLSLRSSLRGACPQIELGLRLDPLPTAKSLPPKAPKHAAVLDGGMSPCHNLLEDGHLVSSKRITLPEHSLRQESLMSSPSPSAVQTLRQPLQVVSSLCRLLGAPESVALVAGLLSWPTKV